MQSLCTLRNHCRQWHATLATKRTLLLTWAGLPPAGSHQLCLAHSFDHLVGESEQGWWDVEAERLRGLEIDDQLDVACDVLSQLQRVMDNPRFLLSGECEPLRAGDQVRIYARRGPYFCIYPRDRTSPCKWTLDAGYQSYVVMD